MGSGVIVSGMMGQGAGGHKEATVKTFKHFREVGDILLNMAGVGTPDGLPIDKDDPRPPYVFQEWPKAMYHADGRLIDRVHNKDEVKAYQEKGFRLQPYLVPQVAIERPEIEKKMLMDENASQRARMAIQQERLDKLEAQIEKLLKAK